MAAPEQWSMRARQADVKEAVVPFSRIEKVPDVRLSTLERYVEALGGKLDIHAVFDDDDVRLTG